MIPHRNLGGYIARLFAFRSIVMLFVLVGIIQMLDLLSNTDVIMLGEGASDASISKYVSLRLPQLISDFTPFAVLLGSLITFAQLSQSSEVTIMRASGLSGRQVITPFCLTALVFSVALFAFHEWRTVPASKELSNWQAANYSMRGPLAAEVRENLWLAAQSDLVKASEARSVDGILSLNEVTIYTTDDTGTLQTVTSAARAVFENGVWQLQEGTHRAVADNTSEAFTTRLWQTPLTPERVLEITVVPEHVPLAEFREITAQLSAEGRDTLDLDTIAWSRFAAPAACMLMPLLGAIAGFGVPRRGAVLSRLAGGMMFGFAYFVVENLMLALGKLGALPPLLAAFVPFLLFTILGLLVLTYTEEHGS